MDLCLSLGEIVVWRRVRNIRVGGQKDLQVTPSLGQLDLTLQISSFGLPVLSGIPLTRVSEQMMGFHFNVDCGFGLCAHFGLNFIQEERELLDVDLELLKYCNHSTVLESHSLTELCFDRD